MAEDLERTFKEFDVDGDGLITEVEFRFAMNTRQEPVTGDEINSIFAHADNDGDGRINLAEFVEAWNS
jgi:Ca2+-binding EF-hand superfamily protein